MNLVGEGYQLMQGRGQPSLYSELYSRILNTFKNRLNHGKKSASIDIFAILGFFLNCPNVSFTFYLLYRAATEVHI